MKVVVLSDMDHRMLLVLLDRMKFKLPMTDEERSELERMQHKVAEAQ